MKWQPYSHSRLSTYLQCPRKFKLQYVEKVKGKEMDSTPLKKGELVHFLIENTIKGQKVSDDALFEKYPANVITEAKNIMKDKFPNNFAVKNLKENGKILSCEEKFGLTADFKPCDYWDKNAFFRGALDCLAQSKNNDLYFIFDWKTGKAKSSIDPILDQLGLYSIVLKETKGIEECIGVYCYIEHDAYVRAKYDSNTRKTQKENLLKIVDKIESDTKFKKNPTPLCGWCQYEDICMKGIK